MASHRVSPPRNPLLSTAPFASAVGRREALRNCANVTYALADLFGGFADRYGYPILDADSARNGVWQLLQGIADVLECAAASKTDPDAFADFTVTFNVGETERLRMLAAERECTVEALIEALVTEPDRATAIQTAWKN